jgi:hypothetical protein
MRRGKARADELRSFLDFFDVLHNYVNLWNEVDDRVGLGGPPGRQC